MKNIVIVGAGAGGLTLATRLGNTLGKKSLAKIILLNPTLTHVWKPLLHEVAAGTLDSHTDEINLVTHAYHHHFHFQLGNMEGLDRRQKHLYLAPLIADDQEEILPRRFLAYDILIMAVGSESNDFHIPGVSENCLFLDSREEAEHFRQEFLKAFISSQHPQYPVRKDPLTITIVGGGATGVELAAELHYAAQQAARYGWACIKEHPVAKISIIDGSPTILANLPQHIIKATTDELAKRDIAIYTREKVTKVDANGVHLQSGRFIPSEMKVWAAGIKAPAFLNNLDGLETNQLNQLLVKPSLQTTKDEDIFAFGDCASCPRPDSKAPVPPRAQAAHQQAIFLTKAIKKKLNHRPLPVFYYKDHGVLVSLSKKQAVGQLTGGFFRQLFISGWFARVTYRFLYRQHQAVLHNWCYVFLLMIANWLTYPVNPRLKLH